MACSWVWSALLSGQQKLCSSVVGDDLGMVCGRFVVLLPALLFAVLVLLGGLGGVLAVVGLLVPRCCVVVFSSWVGAFVGAVVEAGVVGGLGWLWADTWSPCLAGAWLSFGMVVCNVGVVVVSFLSFLGPSMWVLSGSCCTDWSSICRSRVGVMVVASMVGVTVGLMVSRSFFAMRIHSSSSLSLPMRYSRKLLGSCSRSIPVSFPAWVPYSLVARG